MAWGTDEVEQRASVRLERAIVLMLLRDPGSRVSRSDIDAAILDGDPARTEAVLRRLEQEGVIDLGERGACASRAVRHLDALSLIGI